MMLGLIITFMVWLTLVGFCTGMWSAEQGLEARREGRKGVSLCWNVVSAITFSGGLYALYAGILAIGMVVL